MICPHCHSEQCKRSKRRGLQDAVLTLLQMRPWRCDRCKVRFHAWTVAVPFSLKVHCRLCGNFDLQRISARHLEGWHARLIHFTGIPAYRCVSCRHRFFSILFRSRLRSAESEEKASLPSQAV